MTSMRRSGSIGQTDKVCIKVAVIAHPSSASSYQFVIDLEASRPSGHQCAGLALVDGHPAATASDMAPPTGLIAFGKVCPAACGQERLKETISIVRGLA